MAFKEIEFPRQLGFDSQGGDTFNTTINESMSGFEQRNQNWENSRGKWQINLKGKDAAYFDEVRNFFLNMKGMANDFRFLWPIDFEASAQFIATADGSADPVYQLIKTYTTGSDTYVRKIVKPIMSEVLDFEGNFLDDTVIMYDNGIEKTLGSDYTVDHTTGLVSFLYTPTSGHTITGDFEFHFPARFNIDNMDQAQINESNVKDGKAIITWSQVNLIEVRL